MSPWLPALIIGIGAGVSPSSWSQDPVQEFAVYHSAPRFRRSPERISQTAEHKECQFDADFKWKESALQLPFDHRDLRPSLSVNETLTHPRS